MRILHAAAALALLCSSANAQTMIGRWEWIESTDKITDEKRYLVSAESPDRKSLIVVKCDNKGPDSLYIEFILDEFLEKTNVSETNNNKIIYRFDKLTPSEMYYRPNSNSAIIFDSNTVRRFLSEARERSALVVRAIGHNQSRVEAEFDITGAEAAIEKVSADCLA